MDPIKKINLKRGLTGGSVPTELSFGELAVNTFDRKFFLGSSQDEVLDFPSNRVFFYGATADFIYALESGAFGLTCSETHFKFGDSVVLTGDMSRFTYIPKPGALGLTSGCLEGIWVELRG